MKSILTILIAVVMLISTSAFADSPNRNTTILTKNAAKEMGFSKQVIDQLDELNQELNREIKIASIVYKNHPIMMEAKIDAATEKYNSKLKHLIPAEQYQAYMQRQ